jgi:hypothetical protein
MKPATDDEKLQCLSSHAGFIFDLDGECGFCRLHTNMCVPMPRRTRMCQKTVSNKRLAVQVLFGMATS